MERAQLSDLLNSAGDLAGSILSSIVDTKERGGRPGQYALDLAVDGPLVDLLTDAGLGVLSEEAGEMHMEREQIAVLDPVDGSTNASLGLPWFATSICVVDLQGPLHSLVVNHASGDRFEASRGNGTTKNGAPLSAPPSVDLSHAVVGVNGRPPVDPGWWQFRSLGASALDLCAVASGSLHGFIDLEPDAHGVWDYLGAMLICAEVGVPVLDRLGRELVVLDHRARRSPVAASNTQLLAMLQSLEGRAESL